MRGPPGQHRCRGNRPRQQPGTRKHRQAPRRLASVAQRTRGATSRYSRLTLSLQPRAKFVRARSSINQATRSISMPILQLIAFGLCLAQALSLAAALVTWRGDVIGRSSSSGVGSRPSVRAFACAPTTRKARTVAGLRVLPIEDSNWGVIDAQRACARLARPVAHERSTARGRP
jgi:hypothetical protein